MTKRRAEDIRKAIDGELSGVGRDPFLYQRVLNMAQQTPPRRRAPKLTVALAVLLVLMLTTAVAVATNWLGVQYFLTNRRLLPLNVEETYIVHPVSQRFDSERIDLTVLEAYWHADVRGDKLALTMHAEAKQPEQPFCMDIDIGTDGENFDMIWWHGDILPVVDWLDGRDGYVLSIQGSARMDLKGYYGGVDYIQEESGLTVMMELRDVPNLSEGVTLTTQVEVWPIRPFDSELGFREFFPEKETVTLTITLPPMSRGPARAPDEMDELNG